MINFDNVTKEKKNENGPEFLNHLYRIVIIGGTGSVKTNS